MLSKASLLRHLPKTRRSGGRYPVYYCSCAYLALSVLCYCTAALNVDEEVFALSQLTYTTDSGEVIVPAAGLGTVYSNDSSLQVLWTEAQKVGVVQESLVERRTCLTACPGLADFLPTAAQAVLNTAMQQVDRCFAMMEYNTAAICSLAEAQEEACPTLYAKMKEFDDACDAIGVDITSTVSEVQPLFQKIFALGDMTYQTSEGSGTTSVAVGTEGRILSRTTSLTILWDEPAGLAGKATTSQVDNVTCLDLCDGIWEYIYAMAEADADTSLNDGTRCLALEGYVDASACALKADYSKVCPGVHELVSERATTCAVVGVDLTGDDDDDTGVVVKDFTFKSCTYCSSEKGALDLSGTSYATLLYQNVDVCKEWCSGNSTCRATDYDTSRKGCRLWSHCPTSAQRTSSSCAWALYYLPTTTTTETTSTLTTTSSEAAHVSVLSDSRRICGGNLWIFAWITVLPALVAALWAP